MQTEYLHTYRVYNRPGRRLLEKQKKVLGQYLRSEANWKETFVQKMGEVSDDFYKPTICHISNEHIP